MPIVAWYILAVSPAVVLLLIDGVRMLVQRRARRRAAAKLAARRAERIALLKHIADTDPAAFRRHFDAVVAEGRAAR